MEPDEDGDQLSVGDEGSGGKTGEGRESEIYLRNADEIPAAIELSSSVAPRLRYMVKDRGYSLPTPDCPATEVRSRMLQIQPSCTVQRSGCC